MHRRFAFAAAALAPLAFAAPASAGEWYAKLSAGQSQAEVAGMALDEGLAYGAALGTSVGPVRVEAGVDRLDAALNAGFVTLDADALVYSASAYLDLPVGEHAALYAGAGIDRLDGEASFGPVSFDASGEGWHWSLGGAYRLNERMIAEAQFTQLTVSDLDLAGTSADLEENRVTLGLRLAL